MFYAFAFLMHDRWCAGQPYQSRIEQMIRRREPIENEKDQTVVSENL